MLFRFTSEKSDSPRRHGDHGEKQSECKVPQAQHPFNFTLGLLSVLRVSVVKIVFA